VILELGPGARRAAADSEIWDFVIRSPTEWLACAGEQPGVIDALDRVSVQLELGYDGGWEVNPAGAQLGERDGLVAGLVQSPRSRCCCGQRASSTGLPLPMRMGVSDVPEPRCRHSTFGLGLVAVHCCRLSRCALSAARVPTLPRSTAEAQI
jgi:hypothetical protein